MKKLKKLPVNHAKMWIEGYAHDGELIGPDTTSIEIYEIFDDVSARSANDLGVVLPPQSIEALFQYREELRYEEKIWRKKAYKIKKEK